MAEYPKMIYPAGPFGNYVIVNSKAEEDKYGKPEVKKEVKMLDDNKDSK